MPMIQIYFYRFHWRGFKRGEISPLSLCAQRFQVSIICSFEMFWSMAKIEPPAGQPTIRIPCPALSVPPATPA